MPLSSPVAWSRAAVRAVTLAFAVTLVATSLGGAEPASANGLGDRISANRYGQRWAESAMRAQDAVLVRVKRDQKAVRKDLKRTKRDLKQNKALLARAKATLIDRRERLTQAEDLYDDPSLAPSPEAYADRLRNIRRQVRQAERRKVSLAKRTRVGERMVRAKQARLRSLKRLGRATIARRESAEGSLAAYIVQMEDLAAARAENQAAVSLGGAGSFSWPTTGRISQTYGCTGFRLNPRRGSCRHFHDGIDIVDGYGTPVRAVAVGVVAYAGWNPWDEGGRAWIVVIAHPDGWVSRYGHMIPGDKVRAGEVVHTGQIIGRMGNTGRSTGTHLHLEMLRGGRDVNPLAYLPAGVVKIKVDKTSTKKGKQALRARKQAKKQARLKARRKAEARAEARRAEAEAKATGTSCPVPQPVELPELLGLTNESEGGPPSSTDAALTAVDCPGGVSDAGKVILDPAATGSEGAAIAAFGTAPQVTGPAPAARPLPGVPRPPRGTSPVPS